MPGPTKITFGEITNLEQLGSKLRCASDAATARSSSEN
jgi:hypothetical protein